MSPVVRTSASSTKHPTARRSATTTTGAFVSAWEHRANGPQIRHDEALNFTAVPLQTRDYV